MSNNSNAQTCKIFRRSKPEPCRPIWRALLYEIETLHVQRVVVVAPRQLRVENSGCKLIVTTEKLLSHTIPSRQPSRLPASRQCCDSHSGKRTGEWCFRTNKAKVHTG